MILVFSSESSSPRMAMNCLTAGRTLCSSVSFETPVTTKSSAYLTKLILDFSRARFVGPTLACTAASSPSNAMFAITGK
ncbi:hypothetical protein D9M71_818260 [compost metagenome]